MQGIHMVVQENAGLLKVEAAHKAVFHLTHFQYTSKKVV